MLYTKIFILYVCIIIHMYIKTIHEILLTLCSRIVFKVCPFMCKGIWVWDSSISHLLLISTLWSFFNSEEEGSQELKKFQQRYAPQIMAAKMLQVNQNPGNASPTTDLAFEQVMNLLNSSPTTDAPSTSSQTNSFACSSSISSPDSCPGKCVSYQFSNILLPFIFKYKIHLKGQVEKHW